MTLSVTFDEKTYALDEWGYLFPPEQWDERFAEGMAKTLGIYSGLTERHWKIINYLRQKFVEEKTVPVMVMACADNQMRLSELRSRFPTGYHRGACKIAGINYKFMWETNYWLTYETTNPQGKRYPLSPAGFLEDFGKWDEGFVPFMMHELDGPDEPTDRHWQVIHYLRDYYKVYRNIPSIFETCTNNGVDLDEIRELFPAGYRRGACRVAGLPFFG